MAKAGKKRVSITVTAEQFDTVSSILEEKGLPSGYLSYYLDNCIQDLLRYLEPDGSQETDALTEFKIDLFERDRKTGKTKTANLPTSSLTEKKGKIDG